MQDENAKQATEEDVIPLVVGEKTYDLNKMPDEIKQLVVYFRRWETELTEARLEVAKIECAMRDITREIKGKIAQMEDSVASVK